jgi:hypothetical protein
VANPICTNNTVSFNPDKGQDIVVPLGFKVSVFATGLNFPTGIAFRGDGESFEVFVLESGHGHRVGATTRRVQWSGASSRRPTHSRPTSWCSAKSDS